MNKELIEKIIAYNYNEYGAEFGDALVDLKHENEWLYHIIKEVREYIESGEYRFREGTDICLYQEGNEVFYMENDELMARKILSILDKGE